MDIRQLIIDSIKKNGFVRTNEITKTAKVSRAYANRILRELRDEGRILLIGQKRNSRYVMSDDKTTLLEERSKINAITLRFNNKNLSEDQVLKQIKQQSGIFINTQENVDKIVSYAFTEMVNNVIEHSQSDLVYINMKRDSDGIWFKVSDRGVGIFNNICTKMGLYGTLEAIDELIKGSLTTAPKHHTGHGVYFTSKLGDVFSIESGTKKITFNTILDDVFINNQKEAVGTTVSFFISLNSKKILKDVFKRFATLEDFIFLENKVVIKLFKTRKDLLSRSEAKRLMTGLEKFQEIEMDFTDIEIIGQAFADEVFRVWQSQNPSVKIISSNADENIDFMIKRAKTNA